MTYDKRQQQNNQPADDNKTQSSGQGGTQGQSVREDLREPTTTNSQENTHQGLKQDSTEEIRYPSKINTQKASASQQLVTMQELLEQRDHFADLRHEYVRHLRILEHQQAKFGLLHAPAHIITEIMDTKKIISKINRQIASVQRKITKQTTINQIVNMELPNKAQFEQNTPRQETKQILVNITYTGTIDEHTLSSEQKNAVRLSVAGILGILPEQVIFIKAISGSIIFTLKMPRAAAAQLVSLMKINHPRIQATGIIHVHPEIDTLTLDFQTFQDTVDREIHNLEKPGQQKNDKGLRKQLERDLLIEEDPEKEQEILEQLYKLIQRDET